MLTYIVGTVDKTELVRTVSVYLDKQLFIDPPRLPVSGLVFLTNIDSPLVLDMPLTHTVVLQDRHFHRPGTLSSLTKNMATQANWLRLSGNPDRDLEELSVKVRVTEYVPDDGSRIKLRSARSQAPLKRKHRKQKVVPRDIKIARRAVRKAVKNGTLIRPSRCSICNKDCKTEAHHESYEIGQVLNVRWLCRMCHELADYRREQALANR